ncbi:MAG: NUDIX hydrolase [Dehalococcoidia bacterium]|nr:NUDIX hydrolase [Dehalococcoidia bacterium]
MSDYRTLSSKRIYSGQVISLRVDKIQLPSGQKAEREVIEHLGAVAIVAVEPNGNILLVKQYRHPTGKELLEIPAGGVESGETPEETARRELQEETGFFPGELERLAGFYSAPGFSNEFLHLFLATDLSPSLLIAEDTSEIQVVSISPLKAMEMIKSGEIIDAKSIIGLLYYLSLSH